MNTTLCTGRGGGCKLWCEIMDDLNFVLYHFFNVPIFLSRETVIL